VKIGVIPNLDRVGGGLYQYAVTLVDALAEAVGADDSVVVFLYGGEEPPPQIARLPLEFVPLRARPGVFGRAWYATADRLPARLRAAVRNVLSRHRASANTTSPASISGSSEVDPYWAEFFSSHGVDMLVFTTDVALSYTSGVPYMIAIHDVQHRLQPGFPEVSADGEWERREERISKCVRNAALVLVDSEVGREDILTFYGDMGVEPEAVFVLPFQPAAYLDTAVSHSGRSAFEAYHLPGRYLFYPAAFWPHKNHLRIVEALAIVRERGHEVPLVLVGPNTG